MDDSTIHTVDTKRLAKLLDPRQDTHTIYHDADPALVLQHQLDAPLAEELNSPICRTDQPLPPLDESLKTFADLFSHPHPPLELLRRAKEFAKCCRSDPDLLPPEVATVLYYAAIAAARVRLHEQITDLDEAELQKGLTWAMSQTWLDANTMRLMQDASAMLQP